MKKLYGLLGEKLSHSFSPQIHSYIFKQTKNDAYYHLFEVERNNLQYAVNSLKVLNISGVNVTIPYKVEIMKYLDEVSKEALKIGAVNTIVLNKNKTIGYNTDYYGFGMMLSKFDVSVKGKKAVILGTGGASMAVTQYLLDNDVSDITYVSRNKGNNRKVKGFNVIGYDDLKHIGRSDIIINCTPCGMFPYVDKTPVKPKVFDKFNTAVDLIYNPKETIFLKNAKNKGLKCVNGMYMLIYQAVKSQELWINKEIDSEVVDKIYENL